MSHVEMKDSGIDWIGQIPSHWEIKRLKNFLKFCFSGGTPTATNESFYSEDGTPWVTISDMSDGGCIFSTENSVTPSGILDKKLKIVPKGTLLYSMYASVGFTSFLEIKATINQAILALGFKKNTNKKFIKYFLQGARLSVLNTTTGTTQNNLNANKVKNILITKPPLIEQQKIADFLDFHTSKIDKEISLLEDLVNKLEEYLQSVIFETVTKGLDPSAEMKDSGIEWIGQIPNHWETLRLKDFATIKKGDAFNEFLASESGKYPYINGGMTPSNWTNSSNTKANTIAVSEGGASAGYAQFMTTKYWAGSHCYQVKTKRASDSNKYLFYLLRGIAPQLMMEKTGSAMPNLQKTRFVNYVVNVTHNKNEQQKIAEFLDYESEKTNNKITSLNEKINLLKEYKQSLIYEAVTGKMEIK